MADAAETTTDEGAVETEKKNEKKPRVNADTGLIEKGGVKTGKVLRIYQEAHTNNATYAVFIQRLQTECGYGTPDEAKERFKRCRAEFRGMGYDLPPLAGDAIFRQSKKELAVAFADLFRPYTKPE